jgi:hypothetical protein
METDDVDTILKTILYHIKNDIYNLVAIDKIFYYSLIHFDV